MNRIANYFSSGLNLDALACFANLAQRTVVTPKGFEGLDANRGNAWEPEVAPRPIAVTGVAGNLAFVFEGVAIGAGYGQAQIDNLSLDAVSEPGALEFPI